MTRDEKLALAKAAIQSLRHARGLRWNVDSWDYALFEKRLKVGIALEERPIDPNVTGFLVVRDDDTVESFAHRLAHALGEAGLGDKVSREQPPPYERSRDRRAFEESD